MPPAPTVGAAVLNEQPPRPLVLMLQMNQELHARPCHQHGTSRKQNFRDVFEWVRSWLHSPCWRIPPQTLRRVPSKVSLRRSNLKVAKFQKGNNNFEGADLWLCLTEAAAWVCVARRIDLIALRFTQLQPRVQSRAAESQKERIASHLNLIASHLNWIANHLNAWCTRFHCRSRPRNNRSCQFRAACISCVGNRCQGIQFCLQKPSNYLAEAVHRFCRCLTVATVLDFHVLWCQFMWCSFHCFGFGVYGFTLTIFPSNAFMASARSLHMFNRSKKMNCNYHARLSTCR